MQKYERNRNGQNARGPFLFLWWLLAISICLGVAAVRIWLPEKLVPLQHAVFGRDEAWMAEVFSLQDSELAVWSEYENSGD